MFKMPTISASAFLTTTHDEFTYL